MWDNQFHSPKNLKLVLQFAGKLFSMCCIISIETSPFLLAKNGEVSFLFLSIIFLLFILCSLSYSNFTLSFCRIRQVFMATMFWHLDNFLNMFHRKKPGIPHIYTRLLIGTLFILIMTTNVFLLTALQQIFQKFNYFLGLRRTTGNIIYKLFST